MRKYLPVSLLQNKSILQNDSLDLNFPAESGVVSLEVLCPTVVGVVFPSSFFDTGVSSRALTLPPYKQKIIHKLPKILCGESKSFTETPFLKNDVKSQITL